MSTHKRSIKKLAKRYRKVLRQHWHDWRGPKQKAMYKSAKSHWRYRNRVAGAGKSTLTRSEP